MIPDKISHFEIQQKLGQGGMGEVFLAKDTKLDRSVALKILPADFVSNPNYMQRFVREAKAASALSHSNVAHVYEIGEDNGIHFIAMEYIPGETLATRMQRKPLSSDEIINVGLQAADALQEAHSKGIIHRDLKPANIMINSRDQVKLVDFGLAKVHSKEESISSRISTASQTELGTIIGTLPYMSPEQVVGKNVDHRTDYFSLGTVLYEMTTQKLPFQGNSAIELANEIIHKPPAAIHDLNRQAPPELAKIISKLLAKEPDARYQSADQLLGDLRKLHDSRSGSASLVDSVRKRSVAIPIALILAVIVLAAIWMFHRNSKIRWAREEAIPQITKLSDEGKYPEAVSLAYQAEKYIPNDPILKTLWPSMAVVVSIQTDPPGADIFMQDYKTAGEHWKKIGTTPIKDLKVPKGYYRCKISKNGYRTFLAVIPRGFHQRRFAVSYSLKDMNSVPNDMVYVPGLKQDPLSVVSSAETTPIQQNFWMDRYEVSNKEFKKFVDAGGYRNQKYWKVPFVKDGRELSFDEAMKYFHDATGRPGPLQWEVGSYTRDEDDYPVTGVSWYEAAAYAEFVGKNLPTLHHWYHSAGSNMNEQILAISNFNGRGLRLVSDPRSLSPYGTFNMAGNVKEWCWNETIGGKRFILGGSYAEPVYLFMESDQRSPFDREKTFGFRCVKYPTPMEASLTKRFEIATRDYSKEKPVEDAVYTVLKTFYSYDKKVLNSKVESSEVQNYVRVEKVSFDAAYGNERMAAYVFLPVNTQPPYQTIVFFPGAGAQRFSSSSENIPQLGYADYLDFLVRSGRAAVFPIYKGTFERGGGPGSESLSPDELRNWRIQIIKDVCRTVDYLESRNDINKNKLAYYGNSWGARIGSFVGAIETRFQTMILTHGGLPKEPRPPETDELNFVTHVKMPVLMINGKYDHVFPVETSQKPMFQLLGTPDKDKVYLIFEGGHNTPREDVIKVVLDWLDRYLGTVS